MFTCNCLIRKDTEALRKTLALYGYKTKSLTKDNYDGLMVTKRSVVGVPFKRDVSDGYQWTLEKYLKWNPHVYDCGDNEELFLALASMSDHQSAHSWFIDLEGNFVFYDNATRSQQIDVACCRYELATKDQLINYFTKS